MDYEGQGRTTPSQEDGQVKNVHVIPGIPTNVVIVSLNEYPALHSDQEEMLTELPHLRSGAH